MVQEILLELIQDHQQVRAGPLGPAGQQVDQRAAVPGDRFGLLGQDLGDRVLDGPSQTRQRIVGPAAKRHHDELGVTEIRQVASRLLPKMMFHAGAQHAALAHAAGSVEQGQPSGLQVGRDDLAVGVSAEEVGPVVDRERDQADVGAVALRGAHPPPPAAGNASTRRCSSAM